MCFQASIKEQFSFMQKTWVNNEEFINDGTAPNVKTGIDPVIGQPKAAATPIDHQWFPEYGQTTSPVKFHFGEVVKLKGGEVLLRAEHSFLSAL